MAFEGHKDTMTNSLFPIYQRQASMNVGCGGNGSVPFISIPGVSLHEPDTPSYVPWSHNAHDDPYELINCTQNHTKNRKPNEISDDGETELQGLVSNILDEADSQDSFYSDGSLPKRNIWSPKTLRDELLQYFQSEAKSQYNSNFPPNYASYEAINKTKSHAADNKVEEFCQPLSNGFSTNQHLLFNLPNGVRESFTQQGPQKPPPGIPVPSMENAYLSQLQQNNYDNIPVNKERGNHEPMDSFPGLSHVFRPQTDVNSVNFCYDDHYTQGMDKPLGNEQYTPLDLNQLVSSFQSFVAVEQDTGEFPNMSTVRMQHEDHMADKWGNTSPAMPTRGNPSGQRQRQLGADFGTVQRERNGATRKQLFKCDPLQDLSAFTLQNAEYAQQPKVSVSNQHQNKMLLQRENTSLPVNMNHYTKHQVQQSPMQSKFKPQMQKEKKRMAGFLCESYSTRPLTNNELIPEEKRPALSQTPFFDLPFNMRPQRLDNRVLGAGTPKQFMPLMYPGNDPRRHPGLPLNPSFSPRSSLAFGSGVSSMEMCDVVSANEIARFNCGPNNMMSRSGENTYHGMASAVTALVAVNQGGAVIQLYFYLDECYEQWRCLEKERKRMEIALSKMFLGKRSTALPNSSLPKTPPNPTRVDHLIVNQMKEQARVASLLDKMECLSNVPLHANIYTALNKHHMAVCVTSARRKEEISNLSQNQRQRANFIEERDTMLLVIALKDLGIATRKLRTAMWCALQVTLPKPVKKQEQHIEEKKIEKTPSPIEGYSFKL